MSVCKRLSIGSIRKYTIVTIGKRSPFRFAVGGIVGDFKLLGGHTLRESNIELEAGSGSTAIAEAKTNNASSG